jgi:hypothetical protein
MDKTGTIVVTVPSGPSRWIWTDGVDSSRRRGWNMKQFARLAIAVD